MGQRLEVKCKKCGHVFEVNEGGGFFFHMLHCDTCGKEKSISFKKLGETHLQYLKGLNCTYCIASSEHDVDVRENYSGDPISEEEYHRKVEEKAGQCKCGGHFRMDAPIRCPKCRSVDFEETGMNVCYFD